nr:MAG TPA: hypothetical protein [Caudoviricetes sp.]
MIISTFIRIECNFKWLSLHPKLHLINVDIIGLTRVLYILL